MAKETMPDYPLFGESEAGYREWHFHRFCGYPDEKEIRQWRKFTFANVRQLPVLNCNILDPKIDYSELEINSN